MIVCYAKIQVLLKNGDMIEQCKCFKQALLNESYKQSNINKLEEENFETFDIGFYSNKRNKEKYRVHKKYSFKLCKKY